MTKQNNMPYLDFLGLHILRRSTDEMVEKINEHRHSREPLNIAFCNANTLVLAAQNPGYLATLQKMTLLNDGVGVDIAAKILGEASFEENLNGTDFVPAILEKSDENMKVFLLGAKPEIVDKAQENFSKRFTQHDFCGTQHGYFSDEETPAILSKINEQKPDLILVAMGNPKQEHFIMQYRENIDAPIIMGIGALFDFTAEAVQRAPVWVRKLRTEWLYRLAQEPKRLLHRYSVGIGRFIWLCVKLRIQRKKAANKGAQ